MYHIHKVLEIYWDYIDGAFECIWLIYKTNQVAHNIPTIF